MGRRFLIRNHTDVAQNANILGAHVDSYLRYVRVQCTINHFTCPRPPHPRPRRPPKRLWASRWSARWPRLVIPSSTVPTTWVTRLARASLRAASSTNLLRLRMSCNAPLYASACQGVGKVRERGSNLLEGPSASGQGVGRTASDEEVPNVWSRPTAPVSIGKSVVGAASSGVRSSPRRRPRHWAPRHQQ